MNSAPAFTSVPARRAFAPAEPAQPPPTRKIEWPQTVREYVRRCFEPDNALPGIAREDMEVRLKRVLTEAAEGNLLMSINWSTYPLPQQILQQEKMVALTKSIAVNIQADADTTSRKRKSDYANGDDTPPWRKTNKPIAFEDRITYADKQQSDKVEKRKKGKFNDNLDRGSSKFQSDIEKRRQRFETGNLRSPSKWSRDDSPSNDPNAGPVVGTCQNLEKHYLRLTAPPKPETVRPLSVLEKTLDHLKKKWRQEGNYTYICDQFKSLRQDLTVQHIKNEFTVKVYEIHARIALEKADLGEYNQCQTQLRALYSQKISGNPAEFLAYRILYFIHTCNRTGMSDVLSDLTATDKEQPAVKHALDVRSSLALGNYHRFFRLYLETPNMGAYLMDMFIVRERLAALANISKAYKPDVKIRFLTEELGFESDGDCVQFLCDHGAQDALEEKEDGARMLTGKIWSVFESAKTQAFSKVDIKGQI